MARGTAHPARRAGALAEVYADQLDWHQVARLVQRGCRRGWPCASTRWWADPWTDATTPSAGGVRP